MLTLKIAQVKNPPVGAYLEGYVPTHFDVELTFLNANRRRNFNLYMMRV